MADLSELLAGSSRTFALTIPLLSEPVRTQATLAYLLLRIADTLEDAEQWSAERRIEELMAFARLLGVPAASDVEAFRERLQRDAPTGHAGYLALLAATPQVLESFAALPTAEREVIARFTRMTIEGMASTLERLDGRGRLLVRDLEELRRYCYFVAGLVGELLTELFLLAEPALQKAAAALRSRAPLFGEGLQLTNILKDSEADAREGRLFLPPSVPRAQVMALARADLEAAAAYAETLFAVGGSRPLWTFAALPIRLAMSTLDAVERDGAGAKVGRAAVARMVAELESVSGPTPYLSGRP